MVLNSLRKYMIFVGTVKSNSTGYQKNLIITSNCFCFVAVLLYWTAIFCYFALEPQTLLEYAESGYFVIISTTEAALYLFMLYSREEYFQLFSKFDSLVNKSKQNSILVVN